jgi:hypothetical protein
MDDNTALVLILAIICALAAIRSVAHAWASRPRTCDCPCKQKPNQ